MLYPCMHVSIKRPDVNITVSADHKNEQQCRQSVWNTTCVQSKNSIAHVGVASAANSGYHNV